MDIQHINSLTVSGINKNELSSMNKLDVAQKINELSGDTANISLNNTPTSNRSSIASDISGYLNDMANVESISTTINQQLHTIDKIQYKVSSLSSGTVTQEQIQPDIAKLITSYNKTNESLNIKLQKLEDLNGDSHTYFDGAAGAIPLDIDMLNNTMSDKRVELKNSLEKVEDLQLVSKQQAQKVITQEVVKTQEQSPFEQIDFGKESADFNTGNMSNIVGSVVSAQANAVQSHNMRLLS